MSISNSTFANNTGGNCGGGLTDQGYNLESSTDCGFTGTGSLQKTDPQLGGLQNNGGPTQTIALLSNSPAIDHIPAANCPATDQRGFTRPDGASESACDIGAYESGGVPPDSDLGLTNMPANITTNATSPQGAIVNYTVTATDPDNAASDLTITCSPVSGSTFAIGTTTVNCSASDPAGNSTSGSFQVVVNGAATQVSSLITTVNSFHLSSSLQNALDNKLQDVLTAIKAGQTATACSELTDFIGHVQSQSGKGLTMSQANQLIKAAKQIQAVLGC